jgi:hypothetical protein
MTFHFEVNMSDPYSYWMSALAGEKPKCFVDDPQLGFYHKGVYQRGITRKGIFIPQEGANSKRVGWEPVAIFMNEGEMTGRVGDEDLTGDALNELWTWVAANPISEEDYRSETGGDFK